MALILVVTSRASTKPRRGVHPWLMLGPSLLAWALFVFVPLGLAAYESLFAWDMLTDPVYVGGSSYAAIADAGGLADVALETP